MSLTRDDTNILYDFEKLAAEIEVLNKEIERFGINKEIERFGTKSSGTTPSLAHSTPMTRATIPRHVDSGIATSRATDIGVACENGMYLKQVGTGTRSKTFVDRIAMAKPKRQQENKMYMGFNNERISPVRRPIPDFAVDNKFVTQRQMKLQAQTKC